MALRQLAVATKPGSKVKKPVSLCRRAMSMVGAPSEPVTTGSSVWVPDAESLNSTVFLSDMGGSWIGAPLRQSWERAGARQAAASNRSIIAYAGAWAMCMGRGLGMEKPLAQNGARREPSGSRRAGAAFDGLAAADYLA